MQLREYLETTPKDEKNLSSFKSPKKKGLEWGWKERQE